MTAAKANRDQALKTPEYIGVRGEESTWLRSIQFDLFRSSCREADDSNAITINLSLSLFFFFFLFCVFVYADREGVRKSA